MNGLCKFYIENTNEATHLAISEVLKKREDYLSAIFY